MYRVIKALSVKREVHIPTHYRGHPCMYRWKHTHSSPNQNHTSLPQYLLLWLLTGAWFFLETGAWHFKDKLHLAWDVEPSEGCCWMIVRASVLWPKSVCPQHALPWQLIPLHCWTERREQTRWYFKAEIIPRCSRKGFPHMHSSKSQCLKVSHLPA